MKQLSFLVIFALAALPGCGTKEKKSESKTESAYEQEQVFHYTESPDDTSLPTQTKPRNSGVEITNESTDAESIK